jgi:hypothetical protein
MTHVRSPILRHYTFIGIKVVCPLANLDASSTILILCIKVISKYKPRFRSLPELLRLQISDTLKNVGTFLGLDISRSEVRYFGTDKT